MSELVRLVNDVVRELDENDKNEILQKAGFTMEQAKIVLLYYFGEEIKEKSGIRADTLQQAYIAHKLNISERTLRRRLVQIRKKFVRFIKKKDSS